MRLDKERAGYRRLLIGFFSVLYFVLFVFSASNPFFWDTVQLGSMHAHHIYEHNFRTLVLPNYMDSGHPPLLGVLLALSWAVFGKSLMVSHALMLPFLALLMVQVIQFIGYFVRGKAEWFFISSLVLLDPTLLSQAALVSPDIILVAFFFFVLNQLLQKRHLFTALGLVVLALISMRGMMVCFALFIFILMHSFFIDKAPGKSYKIFYRWFFTFLPAGVLALAFLVFHYVSKGWVAYHEASPWAASFETGGLKGSIRNFLLFIWRVIDFGRVFLYSAAFILLLLNFKNIKSYFNDKSQSVLLYLGAALILVTVVPLLVFSELVAHRYLLPFILILSVFCGLLVCRLLKEKRLKILLKAVIVLGLLSGNLWVYPEGVAMGWDSTLAHMPYYSLKKKMIKYLKENNIKTTQVGTAFPEEMQRKFIDLNNDTSFFHNYDMKSSEYILYSNVYNAFTDADIDTLKSKWIPVKELSSPTVKMILYKKPD